MSQLRIKGMSCQHCVASVTEALEKLPGVKNVVVNLDEGIAKYDGDVEQKTLEKVIDEIGFEVES